MKASEIFSFEEEIKLISEFVDEHLSDEEQSQPKREVKELAGSIIRLESNVMATYQTKQFIILAFCSQSGKSSSILLQIFNKQKGTMNQKKLPQIQKVITTMTFHFIDYEVKGKLIQALILILGTKDGFVKIVSFGKIPRIQPFQIDNKCIVDIKMGEKNSEKQSICYILTEDSKIFFLNLNTQIVVAYFHPVIIMCDKATRLSIHPSKQILMSNTEGGYLLFWKIKSQITNRKKVKKNHKTYDITPLMILQSASIKGVKWSSFYGDFIAIITSEGEFKIFALNIGDKEKEDYAIILQYKIKNGKDIRDAIMFEKHECLIVTKNVKNRGIIECIFFSPELKVTSILEVYLRDENVMMQRINKLVFSENYNIIVAKNEEQYFINNVDFFLEKLLANQEKNDFLRQKYN